MGYIILPEVINNKMHNYGTFVALWQLMDV